MISKGHYAVIQFPLPIFQILGLRNKHNSTRLKVLRSIVHDAGALKMCLRTTYQEVSASGRLLPFTTSRFASKAARPDGEYLSKRFFGYPTLWPPGAVQLRDIAWKLSTQTV